MTKRTAVRGRPGKAAAPLSFRHAWSAPVLPLGGHPEANTLYFGRGDPMPQDVDHVVLQAHARRLREDRSLHVMLLGHANQGAAPAVARELAWQRAQNIRQLLIRFGANKARVATDCSAEVVPPRARAQNRSVRLRWTEMPPVRAVAPPPRPADAPQAVLAVA
jgi:hypothetical protein